MKKVVRINEDTIEVLEDLLEQARRGEITNLIFATKTEGSVKTAYSNVNPAGIVELCSHIQADAIIKAVELYEQGR